LLRTMGSELITSTQHTEMKHIQQGYNNYYNKTHKCNILTEINTPSPNQQA